MFLSEWREFPSAPCLARGKNLMTARALMLLKCMIKYRGANKSLARQEGRKLMFLSEWREFPSAPCLAGEKKLDDSSRLDVVKMYDKVQGC